MIWQPRKKVLRSRFHQRGNIVAQFTPPPPDPFIGAVTFLLSCEEAPDPAQVIVPTIGPTFTAFEASGGIANVSTGQQKFGAQSLFIDDQAGLPDAYFGTAGDFPGATFGASDFTVEFHVRFAEVNGAGREMLGSWVFTQREWQLQINAQTPGDFRTTALFSSDGSNIIGGFQELWQVGSHPTGGALDTWYHIAWTRSGNDWRNFVDGFQVGSTRVFSQTMFDGNAVFKTGSTQSEVNFDNIRITKGIARYTSDFTPPSAAYPST